MKRRGLINPELLYELSLLGHRDLFVVSDAGLPIPRGVNRIDLAVRPGLPSLLDVVDAILLEGIVVEKVVLAEEIKEVSPLMHNNILGLLGRHGITGDRVEYVRHEDLENNYVAKAMFVVRTGEFTPFPAYGLFRSS